MYDPKVQRRPIINIEMKDEILTTLSVVPQQKYIWNACKKYNNLSFNVNIKYFHLIADKL